MEQLDNIEIYNNYMEDEFNNERLFSFELECFNSKFSVIYIL